MDTLQNAPTSNKLINYRPIAEIAVGLMLGIAVCGNRTFSGILGRGNGTHSHKKRAAFIFICGDFPQGRQSKNHNGRLFKHRCRRRRLHSESLSSRSGKGRFVGTEQIPETAFGGYNGIGKVIRRRFER